MGGRKASSISELTGKGKRVLEAQKNLKTALQEKGTRAVVNTALDLLSVSNPALKSLVACYRLVKWGYETYKKAQKKYEETGSEEEAKKTIVKEAIKKGVELGEKEVLKYVVSYTWNNIKSEHSISTPSSIDNLVVYSTTNTLMEVFR